MSHFVLSAWVTFFSTSFLALLVFVKGKAKLHKIFSAYSLCIALWALCFTQHVSSGEAARSLLWSRPLHIFAAFIPVLFLSFTFALISANKAQRVLLRIATGAAVFFAGLSAINSPLFMSGVRPRPGLNNLVEAGLLYAFFFAFFVVCATYGLWLIWQAYLRASGISRAQLRYLLLGSLLGYSGGIDNFLIVFDVRLPLLAPFGTYAIPLYVLIASYAIVRYRLMDINLAITRTAVFVVVYALILGVPLFIALPFQEQLEELLGNRWWVWLLLAYAALATIAHYANLYLQKRVEIRLLAEQRKYQSLLVYAAEGMLKILDLQKLLRLVTWIIVRHVKLSFAALYLQSEEGTYQLRASSGQGVELPQALEGNDPLIFYLGASQSSVVVEELKRSVQEDQSKRFSQASNRLARMKASVAVPSFLKNRLLGFLILGEKLSGQMFTTSDIETFDTLSHEVAIAISNARFHRRTVDVGRLEAAAELVTALSHEFGNVFHSLTIQVGTLAASLDSDNAIPKDILKQASRRLEATAIRGRTIINDVGSFRKQSEKHGIQTFPLALLIQDVVKTMQTRFESRPDIKVKLELPNDLPTIQGFATLPTLPLSLLADSFWALEQIPEGGEISVSVRVDRNQEQAEIRVTDPGKSLRSIIESPDPMEKAELFPERSKHSGVYVFLTRKITNDHHGTLTVMDGSEKSGTTVIVRLPLVYKAETVVEEGIEDILGENSS